MHNVQSFGTKHQCIQGKDGKGFRVPFQGAALLRQSPVFLVVQSVVTRLKAEIKTRLNQAEYSLYVMVIAESSFKAVLNEKQPLITEIIELPPPYAGTIIPESILPARKHPDVRIARRASTIAALARVISERKVTKSLRTTLLTQARRLETLASERLADFSGVADEEDSDDADSVEE